MKDLHVILLSIFDLPEKNMGEAILFKGINETYIYACTTDCMAF